MSILWRQLLVGTNDEWLIKEDWNKKCSISKIGIKKAGKVPAGEVYVDGSRIGDVGSVVINDRKLMSNNGILAIIASIDITNKKLMTTPVITTSGEGKIFIYSEGLIVFNTGSSAMFYF